MSSWETLKHLDVALILRLFLGECCLVVVSLLVLELLVLWRRRRCRTLCHDFCAARARRASRAKSCPNSGLFECFACKFAGCPHFSHRHGTTSSDPPGALTDDDGSGEDSGDEGGTTEGLFISEWKGDILYGRNSAVSGHYILGYGTEPKKADEHHTRDPKTLLVWHANYHPDGGQYLFPETKKPFVVPLALPGDDISPEDFVCFHFSGQEGLYIHPNVWHEGALGIRGKQHFFDKQGAVHARISVDFAREFKCLLEVSLEQFNPA